MSTLSFIHRDYGRRLQGLALQQLLCMPMHAARRLAASSPTLEHTSTTALASLLDQLDGTDWPIVAPQLIRCLAATARSEAAPRLALVCLAALREVLPAIWEESPQWVLRRLRIVAPLPITRRFMITGRPEPDVYEAPDREREHSYRQLHRGGVPIEAILDVLRFLPTTDDSAGLRRSSFVSKDWFYDLVCADTELYERAGAKQRRLEDDTRAREMERPLGDPAAPWVDDRWPLCPMRIPWDDWFPRRRPPRTYIPMCIPTVFAPPLDDYRPRIVPMEWQTVKLAIIQRPLSLQPSCRLAVVVHIAARLWLRDGMWFYRPAAANERKRDCVGGSWRNVLVTETAVEWFLEQLATALGGTKTDECRTLAGARRLTQRRLHQFHGSSFE
jgi:hypothetical protein